MSVGAPHNLGCPRCRSGKHPVAGPPTLPGMAHFLKLMRSDREDVTYALHDDADPAEVERSLAEANLENAVLVPTRLKDQLRETALYVRIGRWDAWQVFSHDPEIPE